MRVDQRNGKRKEATMTAEERLLCCRPRSATSVMCCAALHYSADPCTVCTLPQQHLLSLWLPVPSPLRVSSAARRSWRHRLLLYPCQRAFVRAGGSSPPPPPLLSPGMHR